MKALVVAALVLLLGLSSCRSAIVNELLVEIITDLPEVQLDRIELEVSRDGKHVHRLGWRLTPASAATTGKTPSRLPGTFGLYTNDGTAPTVEIKASGYFGTELIVQRWARVAPVIGERRLLRLALDSGCRGHACAEGQTCIAAACADPTVDPKTLPEVGQAGKIFCGSPGYLDTATGVMLPMAVGGCDEGMTCVEGICRGPQPGTVVVNLRGGTGPLLGSLPGGALPLD